MPCRVVLASEVAQPFRVSIMSDVEDRSVRPKLVGLLANDDPAAGTYAKWAGKSCNESGLDFELRQVPRDDLEKAIKSANEDTAVSGILVYYPVFGDDRDKHLADLVDPRKDVEGLCRLYYKKMHNNERHMDEDQEKKPIIPCTPLAVLKILDHVGVFDNSLRYGDRLRGKTITVVNRSEVVGRPLAALLANDGATVYSVDINDIQLFHREAGSAINSYKSELIDLKLEDIVPKSDVVITGVPSPNYKMPTSLLKEGVIAVNFSTAKNFEESVKERASVYVPSVGKVTVTMLQRNLLRLHDYYNETPSEASQA
ncbi:Methylenetetrahydrofolate dehydrogenase [NAD(+)] [Mycoemilia scoparia]|uniref:Methylenetetrahydrofolate dehydrogenase [NAD(+)] n=1 Tax=Mycoemilia scoparia TaxID=417184 RepID=A0A9W8DSN1_9FUNG|nr:Methylenetetrahydrofolate dehydrogenase [NAD(+)] [Mycoemilia scoparia]